MFEWLKKSRKKADEASLGEVEQMLISASYPAARPSTEFKSKLFEKLSRARRSKKFTHMEKPASSFNWSAFISFFSSHKWIPAAAFAVIILLMLPVATPFFGGKEFLLVDRAYAQSAFEVTAVDSDQSGVDAATSFKIMSKVPLDADELRDNLHF